MLWAVIMAGGSGTRFWPESREKNPKQFLQLFGPRSLFEETLRRIAPVIPKSRVLVVTHQKYRRQVSRLGKIPASQIIGEPVGRNTAPCAALAAARILQQDPQAVLAILPSDHRIGKPERFQKLLRQAEKAAAETGMPVTFGIKPSYAHTGYGYLELEMQKGTGTFSGLGRKRYLSPSIRGHKTRLLRSLRSLAMTTVRFHEKPSLPKARAFVRSARYLWNSGMFVWRADRLLAAVRQFLPEVWRVLTEIASVASLPRNDRQMRKLYPRMPSISIDYGLMEKMPGKVLALPADIDWCDLGGWRAYQDLQPKDKDGNVAQGKRILLEKSRNNLVKAGRKLVALIGVQNLVIVDTRDALLVASKDKVESVRKVAALLKKRGWKRYL